jgi:hypothetical protein
MTEKTRLDNSTYNILRALGKESDFLYSTIDKYIEDANKDNKTHLVEIWNELKTCRTYISSISKNILENVNSSLYFSSVQRFMSVELLPWLRENELLLQRLAWLMSWLTFMLLELLWWCPCAKACWGIANATAVIATAATIAAAKNIISKKKRTS